MSEVTLNSQKPETSNKLCLSPQVRHRAVGDDGVLVHLQNGRVIVVNEVGLYIVQLLQKPTTKASLAESISIEFEVSRAQAESDLSKFLPEIEQENILQSTDKAVL